MTVVSYFICVPFKVSYWLKYCFCFMFWFFGHEVCGILPPQSGVEAAPPASEGKVLTMGVLGKSQLVLSRKPEGSISCLLCLIQSFIQYLLKLLL